MALNLATLNVRGQRDSRKSARLLPEVKNFRVNVTAVPETHLICVMSCAGERF